MPTRRSGLTASVVDGKIYAIGGIKSGPVTVSTVEVYDPATDKWTKKADMPTARFDFASCVVDGRIYVFGGLPRWPRSSPALSTVEVYDPATDTWTQASDMPMAREGHSASPLDGKMYIIGGQDQETVDLWQAGKITEDEMAELFSIVYVYDPATDTWTTAARCPFATIAHAAGIVDGRIYTIGGWVGSTMPSTVCEFDPGLPHAVSTVSPADKLLETWGQVKSE